MQYTEFLNPTHHILTNAIKHQNRRDRATGNHHRLQVQSPPSLAPDWDEVTAECFREFRPSYKVGSDWQKATLQRIKPSIRSGEMLAYYDLKTCNKMTGGLQVTTYLYAIRDGEFKELKKFDPRPWHSR